MHQVHEPDISKALKCGPEALLDLDLLLLLFLLFLFKVYK